MARTFAAWIDNLQAVALLDGFRLAFGNEIRLGHDSAMFESHIYCRQICGAVRQNAKAWHFCKEFGFDQRGSDSLNGAITRGDKKIINAMRRLNQQVRGAVH